MLQEGCAARTTTPRPSSSSTTSTTTSSSLTSGASTAYTRSAPCPHVPLFVRVLPVATVCQALVQSDGMGVAAFATPQHMQLMHTHVLLFCRRL